MADVSSTAVAVRQRLAAVWPLLQATAAASVAWVIANEVGEHPNPFFAPVAALVALTFARGQRGATAVRLVFGVIIGIVAGELTVVLIGGGYGSMALATFATLLVTQLIGADNLIRIQAAAGAILTVAAAGGEAGLHRLFDALIGAGVALVFTQLLFPPEPVALVRRAETAALNGMADALTQAAQAVERDDAALADRAVTRLREVRESLIEVGRVRQASTVVVRRALLWRHRRRPVVRVNENAGHLDLLGASCLMLTRTAVGAEPPERQDLTPYLRELGSALADLAAGLGDWHTRQGAVDRALEVAGRLAREATPAHMALAAAVASVQVVTYDIMVFAGVAPADALAAVHEGSGQLRVVQPPQDLRIPLVPTGSARRRLWRRFWRLPHPGRR